MHHMLQLTLNAFAMQFQAESQPSTSRGCDPKPLAGTPVIFLFTQWPGLNMTKVELKFPKGVEWVEQNF